MNLLELFAIPLAKHPDKVAIDFRASSGDATLTYRQLHDRAARLAARLAAWGLQRGDRVAFFLDNSPAFVVCYLAVLRCGAAMAPINLRYRRREISHILTDSAPRFLIADKSGLPVLEEAGAASAVERILVAADIVDEAGSMTPRQEVEAQALSACHVAGDDLALLLYTSGTTGRSKGAMLTHNNILATITGLLSAWAWGERDRLLLCLPLFHTHGLVVGLHCALAAGASIHLRQKYAPVDTLAELAGGGPTLFFAVPTIYTRLVEELRARDDVPDFSHMRLFCSGSAPLDPETFHAFRALTGHAILERYGMTETGMNLSNLYAGPRVPGTVGLPLPGVGMRIVDTEGRDVVLGDEGELLVTGSNVFDGYWRDAEKTAGSFSHDAQGRRWFHTGDLARQDPNTGYVTLLGRKHELIISGGFNIYPREIEELLLTCPGVMEAAVVGRPDPEWGERPVAYLVCGAEVSDETLIALCRSQLASFKTPKAFVRVTELPRNAMGKLQKQLLP